ncbi:MAG: hypothetical protein Kow00129_07880 [Thermoleophilia bacterium]
MAKTTTKSTSKSARGQNRGNPPVKTGRAVSAVGGNRFAVFLREVRVEMGKVTWPQRDDLLQATLVVIVAVAIAATYIGLWDLVWSSLVNLVRLGG